MKRLAIFSFFDNDGYVDDYVIDYLDKLLPLVSRLIIVANGELDAKGMELFQKYTSEVIIRKNVGYDAGAYKEVLINYLEENELDEYDEILFSNDTFFGPFTSMQDIFQTMEKCECDMWGLNGYLDIIFSHIQSYFLLFRKKIIEQGLLINYFKNYVDENVIDLKKVYCQFEVGLFDYLSREHNMKVALYSDGKNIDVYDYSFAAISKYNLPIVKKKAFANIEKDRDNILCTLSYIKYHTNYDVNMILRCIYRKYNVCIEEEEIKELSYYKVPNEKAFPSSACTECQVEEFIGKDSFYIYGTGIYGHKTYWRFAKENIKFKGFIVSDNQNTNDELFGYPVFHFSDVKDIYSTKVILGVGVENTEQILGNFQDISLVMKIF